LHNMGVGRKRRFNPNCPVKAPGIIAKVQYKSTFQNAIPNLFCIVVFLVRGKKAENRITPLASLAFAFVLAGIIFGEDRLVGYGLMGIGVILAVADILNRARSK